MNPIKCKTILTKSKLPKVDYCYNVYIGCTHSCRYCYAEFMKKFTGHIHDEWGKFLDYKENAIEVLKKEIKKIEKNKWVLLGSVTDTYQPIEKKLLLTRKSLEIFLDYQAPISILTKSDLVLRDIDLLMKFQKCEVGLSFAFTDPTVSNVLEPNASSLDQRLNTLKELKQAGVLTYVFIGPIIPGLSNLEDIFTKVGDIIDFAMAEALNLRCGNLNKLIEVLTELVGKEEAAKTINLCRNSEYWLSMEKEFDRLCKAYKVVNRGFFLHK